MRKIHSVLCGLVGVLVLTLNSGDLLGGHLGGGSAKEVIAKVGEALGGMDRMDHLKTLRFIVRYPGHSYKVTTDIERPNKMRNSGGKGIGLFDGKTAGLLHQNADTGKYTELTPVKEDMIADFYVEPGFFHFYFFDYPAKYRGLKEVEGQKVHVLVVDLPMEATLTYHIDPETSLPIRAIAHVTVKGKRVQWARDYLEYRMVDGLRFPSRFASYYGEPGEKQVATVESVELNPTFPEGHFALPKQD
jgi:hypothetical protein